MYCKNCGHQIDEGKKFCKNCGTPVGDLRVAPPATVRRRRNKWWIPLAVVVVVLIILAVIFLSGDTSSNSSSNIISGDQVIEQSVVDVNCDNGKGGSGTIFTSDGIVLTNHHVIAGSQSCEVTIPNPTTGQISKIYEAAPVIVPFLSGKYDVATLKIDASYTDANGKTWGVYPTTFSAFTLPSTCDPTVPSKLGDSVKIYGYPVTSGGYNLTITDGIISSFADNGDILTSAQVDSGNSGGLAIDQDGCWLGIPSAVQSGNYQNLGVVIPGSIVESFINAVPAKTDPTASGNVSTSVAADQAATPQESNSQICTNNFGDNSEWTGKVGTDGNPYCRCQTGYAWDASGNACATQTSLNLSCQNDYGVGSYSHAQAGKAVCGCSTGYVWNSGQTACITSPPVQSGYQVCAAMNAAWDGSSRTSSGGYSCTCDTGYVESADGSTCVSAPPAETGYQVCSNAGPNETWGGAYAANGNYQCVCDTGYTWNASTQSCE